MPTSENSVLVRWKQLRGSGLGRYIFSRAIGWKVPYSGTIKPSVLELAPGRTVITIKDRRLVRNHLRSIHAAAMLNLVELTGGLMAISSAPPDGRMIVTGVSADFVKKARGTLTSTGEMPVPENSERAEYEGKVTICDASGDVVTRGTVRVLIGPITPH